jgi:glycine/D-amino acid oxidase-like deaminating enzyme
MDRDVLIIGGGVAGISLAAAVAPHASVVLVEAEPVLAHHASSRSAALYEPHYGAAPVVALSVASGPAFRASGWLSPRGIMMVAGPGDEADFVRDAAQMQIAEVSVDDARAVVPILSPAITRAAMADHAWDVDTDAMVQGYARVARAAGVQLMVRAGVTGIVRDGAGWRVATAAGDITATVIVNAAGPWADDIARLAGMAPVGLQPMRRSMARIPAPGGHDVSRWPMIFGPGETWYAKPDAGALIVSPAEEHPMPPHDAFADDMVLAEGLARYEAMVTEPVTRLLASWAGLRTFAPDRVPVIGWGAPGFFWLAGQGGYGFQTAPAAAALAADLLAGRAPVLDAGLLAALSPARFR